MKKQIRPLRYIRKTFDWQTYVEDHYDIKYAGDSELRINCPNCSDRKHKCYINIDKKVFHCFKCPFTTKKGSFGVFDFVALTENISRGRAIIKLLKEYKPVTPEDFEAALEGELDTVPEQPKKFKHLYLDSMPSAAKTLISDPSQEMRPFWDYLVGERGLSPEEITDVLQVCYIPDMSYKVLDYKGAERGDIGRRILWPIYGGDNKLVSWQARYVEGGGDQIKYLNAPDTDMTGTLWPYVPPKPGSSVVICEGILDCIALRRLPNISSYATFSKHISSDQVTLLKETWGVTKVTLFWDQDAKREMKNTVKGLSLNFETYVPQFNNFPKNLDCGDCLKREDGVELLLGAVSNPVKVNSLDYVKWELT